MMREKLYRAVQEICNQALEGKLSIKEFFKIWPQECEDIFLKVVFEDVEDAVEHLPASFRTKEINWDAWKKTDAYKNLLIDKELLELETNNSQKLLECHKIAIQKPFKSETEIKMFIQTYVGQI